MSIKNNTKIIAAIISAALSSTLFVTGVHAQPLGSFHPQVLWATSEEKQGESYPNGTIAALVDDDEGKLDEDKTFWTSQWKGSESPYPHAIALKNTSRSAVCGLQYTARPSYTGRYGEIQGNTNVPAVVSLFSNSNDPGNPAVKDAHWRKNVDPQHFLQTHLITQTTLTATNNPQTISFSPVDDEVIILVGYRAAVASKKGMSASDIQLLPCIEVAHEKQEGAGKDLADLVALDTIPLGEPGNPTSFSSRNHTYTATTYAHTATVSVRAKGKPGTQVRVNGVVPDSHGRVSGIPVREGMNAITVSLTNEQGEAGSYVINVTKKNTDFSGNQLLPSSVRVNNMTDNQAELVTDGSLATSITIPSIKESAQWSQNVTGLDLRLSQESYVRKVLAWGEPIMKASAPSWHGGHSVAIAVKQGDQWKTVVTNASLTRDDNGLWYWDLNNYYRTSELRIWMNIPEIADPQTPPANKAQGLSIREIEVWGSDAPPARVNDCSDSEINTTDGKSTEKRGNRWINFNPQNAHFGVNRAQSLALQYGIALPAWVPSQGYGRGIPDARELCASGGAFPMFYDRPLFNSDLMSNLPTQTPWALAKAPSGANSMSGFSQPKDFLTEQMQPYASRLIDIQYGDEGGYSSSEVKRYGNWFSWSKKNYPGAIVHSNQNLGMGWDSLANMRNYVRTAQPDLLSWDTYYFSAQSGPRPSAILSNMLNNSLWKTQRQAALEGLTGDGTQPILYGQYLDYNWDANVSASQKSIVPMVGLATGQKWFGLFRMEKNGYDRSSLFDVDGAPTTSFYEYADIFRSVRGYGEYLTALNNSYVSIKPGTYSDRSGLNLSGYKMGMFAHSTQYNNEFGVHDVSVSNAGSVNGGLAGDVVLGYFDALPALSFEVKRSVFASSPAKEDKIKAIFVVNALTGDTDYPSAYLMPRTDNGSYMESAQNITLSIAKPFEGAELMQVDPQTFAVSAAQIEHHDNQDVVVLNNVGGGQGRLLFWR